MQDSDAMFTDGAAYERLMGRWSQIVGRQFLDWLAMAPGLDWLDVGCGNGAFTEVIRTHDGAARLSGIDPSPDQIAYARQREGVKGASFHVGDAQQLPFADATFDVAAMALVIVFVPDPARAVAELARVTRPGGHCATYIWDLPGGGLPLAPLFRELTASGIASPMPPSAHISTRSALRELWRQAGFDTVEIETFKITVAFDDFEDFWQSNTQNIGTLAASLRALSEVDRDDLRARLRASLPADANGRIAYSAVANAVKGRRAV